MAMLAFFKGLGIGAGLIVAIGAQNAYLLGQGVRQQHRFTLALTCILIDVVLISLGVMGVGELVKLHPLLTHVARWLGAAFLLVYGAKAFYAAWNTTGLKQDTTHKSKRTWKVIVTVLSISLLNPHIYIDTFVLLGSIGSQFPWPARGYFTLGAICASVIWFFSLTYGAGLLAPFFKQQRAWRILDSCIGCIMWAIAFTLIF